ncbi:MAG: ATP-dependent DNA helicase RecQ [Acidobacteriota bacterium]|nr:ATP-dependent DNA helicase RecQ [Acidobacteriota bacterium]
MDLDAALSRFGHTGFRPGQRHAIDTLLGEGRLLYVAPTGGGKSLTYQLPASLLEGTTLVISPLIALMDDQIASLDAVGVPATYLASTLTPNESRERFTAIREGLFKLVYVAPERLAFEGFRELLSSIECPLVAIDEAHCISEWGHDFRPDYMRIGDVLGVVPNAKVLACTATATPVVRDEILVRLGLGAETPQIVRGFSRPNLRLRAAEIIGARDRRQCVDAQLREALGSPSTARGSAIVYSPTRKLAEEEAGRLQAAGWNTQHYHAGMGGEARRRVGRGFSDGELDVVVATNAFGMGIDRADVRTVVHLAPPGSIEAYYQEVGRAGRDDEPAWGLLLSSAQDMPLRRRLLEMPTDGRQPAPEVVDHKWGLFLELMRWVEGGSCRHDAILRYFGAEEARDAKGCGHCDVCESLDRPEAVDEDAELIVRKALSGVARAHNRFGLTAVAKLLAGVEDSRFEWSGLRRVSTFGVLSEHQESWLIRLLRRCVTAGWVDFTAGQRPLLLLTATGREVMKGARPAPLLLPDVRSAVRSAAGSRGRRVAESIAEDLDEAALDLFEALRLFRLERAREEGKPAYVVASDRCLREIALLRPQNPTELLAANGIGPAKAQRYGKGFLRVVARHASAPSKADDFGGDTFDEGPVVLDD